MMDYQSKKTGLLQKMAIIQQEIAQERGEFTLFALLERESSVVPWDIVVSAPWIGENTSRTIDLMFSALKQHLTQEELLAISRVVALRPEEPFIKEFLAYMRRQCQDTCRPHEFTSEEFYGLEFRHGHVLQWHDVTPSPSSEAANTKQFAFTE